MKQKVYNQLAEWSARPPTPRQYRKSLKGESVRIFLCEIFHAVNDFESKITRYENIILQFLLKAHISEGLAAEWLNIGIVEVRFRMNTRYGNTWRDASDDEDDLFERMVRAGDLDSTLEAVNMTREQAIKVRREQAKNSVSR